MSKRANAKYKLDRRMGELLAVDEERRRPVRAERRARRHVRLDLLEMLVALDRGVELVHVEADLLRHLVIERRADLARPDDERAGAERGIPRRTQVDRDLREGRP